MEDIHPSIQASRGGRLEIKLVGAAPYPAPCRRVNKTFLGGYLQSVHAAGGRSSRQWKMWMGEELGREVGYFPIGRFDRMQSQRNEMQRHFTVLSVSQFSVAKRISVLFN